MDITEVLTPAELSRLKAHSERKVGPLTASELAQLKALSAAENADKLRESGLGEFFKPEAEADRQLPPLSAM